jgi:hypothetical protein
VRMDAKDHEYWQWLEANDEALPALAVQALASRYRLIDEPVDAAWEEEPLPPTVVRKTLLPPPSEHPGAEDARDVAVPKRSGTFPVANLPRPAKVPASGG